MKKLLSVLLVLSMLLALCACGASQAESAPSAGKEETESQSLTTVPVEGPEGFRVGFGKRNITPTESVPMGGYGRSEARMSQGVLCYLWAICLAVTDEDDNTILLISVDLCNPIEAAQAAPAVSEATGVPVENIVISATHTHSSPDYTIDMPSVERSLEKTHKGIVEAAVEAMADRKTAQMYGATVETKNLNFVRLYLCNNGTYCGDNFGDGSSGYARHATDADPMMQLIKFTREGGKDVILTNFQVHPHRTGGSENYELSSDIVGEYRVLMEQEVGAEMIYFSGAGGNLNPTSRIYEENVAQNARQHARAMADFAQTAQYAPLNTGKVQAGAVEFEAQVNHSQDAVADVCLQLRQAWDKGEISTDELKNKGRSYGLDLHSPYHAYAIYARSQLEKSTTYSLWAYSFGDVGFVAAPYEMFDTNGMFIKENSPFAYTVVATLSNYSHGYFPSDFTFETGSYEVDTTRFVRGTAERMADAFVEMLNTQYAAK